MFGKKISSHIPKCKLFCMRCHRTQWLNENIYRPYKLLQMSPWNKIVRYFFNWLENKQSMSSFREKPRNFFAVSMFHCYVLLPMDIWTSCTIKHVMILKIHRLNLFSNQSQIINEVPIFNLRWRLKQILPLLALLFFFKTFQ